ncbi:hypothetical protein ACFL2S_04000 [Thermodesulfobacteriota bacterium]
MAVNSGKRELLKWFLDFMNLDIELLGHGDRLKWITEALYIIELGEPTLRLRPLVRFDKKASHKKISEWDTGTKLEECHGFLKAAIGSMIGNIQQTIDSGKGSVRDQKSIFATFKTATIVRVQTVKLASIPIHNKRQLHTIIDAETDRETLLLSFYRTLDGVQIGALRSCLECGNYFLHITKMEKKFCTNKCAARKASRDRRERIKKDYKKYEAEKKKGADRARKSYVKKTPRGKPARRPTKYKDSTEK